MKRISRPSAALLYCGLLVLSGILHGCGGGGSTSSDGGGPLGGLSIYLTDAPTDEVSSVNVYIVGLSVKRSGDPVKRISDDIGLVDLLTLRDSRQLMTRTQVEAGRYEFIQVNLDQSRSNVVEINNSQTMPLKIASEEIKVLGGFTVEPGGETEVVLDFDADRSLKKRGNGDWLLEPVILKQ